MGLPVGELPDACVGAAEGGLLLGEGNAHVDAAEVGLPLGEGNENTMTAGKVFRPGDVQQPVARCWQPQGWHHWMHTGS